MMLPAPFHHSRTCPSACTVTYSFRRDETYCRRRDQLSAEWNIIEVSAGAIRFNGSYEQHQCQRGGCNGLRICVESGIMLCRSEEEQQSSFAFACDADPLWSKLPCARSILDFSNRRQPWDAEYTSTKSVKMSFFKNLFKEVFASLSSICYWRCAIPICAMFALDIAVRVSMVFKNV
jgi:hypothetical protein